jgi:hypothetical protein
MKKRFAAVVAVLVLALAGSAAVAQQKGPKGKAPAGPQVRYFDLSSGIFAELASEAILKETRQGTTLVSGELEVCHLTEPNSNRVDRFVVPLKVEGNRLTGSGQSQEGKHAVSVNLTRRVAGGNFSFEGTVSSGPNSEKVSSTDNNEVSEEEIADQFTAEAPIEASPSDFTAAWPQSLQIRVGRAGLLPLLEALREQNVRVVLNSLLTSCRVLRSGTHTVQIDVDAERTGAVLAKLKSVTGVTEVGFSPNPPSMQRAVQFPSAGWRDAAGKLDRDKLAATLGASLAKAMSATLSSTSWDASLGELSVELKRPDETVAGLKLTELMTISIVVAPESLSSNQRSILWLETMTSRVVDEGAGSRLTFTTQSEDGGEAQGREPEGADALPEAVAAALKGATWDSDKEQWRP